MIKLLRPALLACCFIGSANAQINISNLQDNVHANNTIRYDVTFNTDVNARSFVSYYYVDGTDTIRANTGVQDVSSTSHSITVMGLVAQTTYNYIAWAFDSTGCYPSNQMSFTTDTIPSNLPIIDSIWTDTTMQLPGFIMTNAHSLPARSNQMWDRNGNIVWYEYPPVSAVNTHNRCKFFNITDHNSILMTDCHKLVEMKYDGTIINDFDLSSRPDLFLHHDIMINDVGNYIAVVSQPRYIDQSSIGGDDSLLVMGQGYVEVDPTGTIVDEWHNFEHFDTLDTPLPGGYWLWTLGPDAVNWMHGNAIMQDDDGNYMMSFKIAHQLAKIDRTTGNLLWTMGNGGTIDVDPIDQFNDQHCINKSAGNNYMLFNNTGLDSLSEVLEFNIDFAYSPPMMYTVWRYVLPQDFFTDILSSGYRLPYSNTLISTGRSQGVFEVTPGKDVAWHIKQNSSVYRAYYIESIYDEIPATTATFFTNICADDPAFALTAAPAGGMFSGNGVTNGMLDPTALTVGAHEIYYKYGWRTDTITINIYPAINCQTGINELTFESSLTVFPNPFDNNVSIGYELKRAGNVNIELFDLTGKQLAIITSGKQGAGFYTYDLGPLTAPLSEGIYLMRFTLDDQVTLTRRLVKQ
jgi:hypothetical protein